MEVSDAKRLKALEEASAKFKKLLAESMLDVMTPTELKDLLRAAVSRLLSGGVRCSQAGPPEPGAGPEIANDPAGGAEPALVVRLRL